MLQRFLSLLYLGTSFALGLFILVHIARKDDVGAAFGAVVLAIYVGTLYVTQSAGARPQKLGSTRRPAAPRIPGEAES